MERIQKILFPVDYSRQCHVVSYSVAAMAGKFGAEITMLHVLRIPAGAAGDWYAYLNLMDVESIKAAAVEELRHYLVSEMEGLKVNRLVMEGEAAETIVRCARETGADLIMMPTRGQTRFRSLMLGSVTTSVLHDAECPVWTSAHSEIDTQPSKYRSILCAVDLSPSSLTVLRRAGQLAQAWAASLYAVHAVPEQSSPNVLMAARGTARSKFVPIAEEAGLDLKLEIIAGPVAEVVRAEATRHGADLVVAGRGQIQGAFGRLRNNIHDIIRTAPCPVLSV